MLIPRSKIVYPAPGAAKHCRKVAIDQAKNGTEPQFIGLADGRVEVYIGTSHCKQGYFKVTYDPMEKRKRPGIPQFSLADS